MTDYVLPSFGKINLSSLNEKYEAVIQLDGKDVTVDINFGKTTIEKKDMDIIKDFIENLLLFDKKNKVFMAENFHDQEGQIYKYTDFHLEEIKETDTNFLEKIGIDSTQSKSDQQKQFLAKLRLVRIGLYPDGKYESTKFGVFDYQTNPDLTDQILVVNTNNKGKVEWISWES